MAARRTARHDGRTTDTRARILREAEQLYYRGGYAGINLQELAGELGLTKPALFHHFRSKQDLFFAMLLEMVEQRRVRIEAAIASEATTAGRLRAVLAAMADCPFFDAMKFLTDERDNLDGEQQQAAEAAFARAIQQPIARVLAEGVDNGDLRPHRPMLGVMMFLNVMMLLPSPGHPNPRVAHQVDRATYIDELLTFFLQGVGGSSGAVS